MFPPKGNMIHDMTSQNSKNGSCLKDIEVISIARVGLDYVKAFEKQVREMDVVLVHFV